MKTVLLRGPALSSSGYGIHCRQIARWLLSKHDVNLKVQALPWGSTPWLINRDCEDGLIGQIMDRTGPVSGRSDVSIQVQLPNEWDPTLAFYNVGVSAVVETDKCHPDWITACNRMQHVIVPSQHALSCLNASGQLRVQSDVVPESFPDCFMQPSQLILKELECLDTKFNILVFGQITGNNPFNDRKNIFFTLKWLFETFANDPEVGIILKTNMGKNTEIDRAHVSNILSQLTREVRKSTLPKLCLVHGNMSAEEVCALYTHPNTKAYVSLTRGEGYGLPTLEAAAAGVPIVATDWSGHLDYLKMGKFIKVAYKLQEIHSSRVDDRIFVKGAKWAEADEADFKKKILKLRNSHTIPVQWAHELRNKVHADLCFTAIAKKYDAVLGNVV